MLDSEEQSLEEHVILLLISKFVSVLRLVRLHQVAELILSQVLFVVGETLHDLNQ